MCTFFIMTRSCNILGSCIEHLQKIMRVLLRVWIAWLGDIMIKLTTIVIEIFIFTAYYPCLKKVCHPKMVAWERLIRNVKIWLEFFSNSFRLLTSFYFFSILWILASPCRKKALHCYCSAYFWAWSRCTSKEQSSFQTTLSGTNCNLTSPLTEEPHLSMTASPSFSL
jgi:hypothetical protein